MGNGWVESVQVAQRAWSFASRGWRVTVDVVSGRTSITDRLGKLALCELPRWSRSRYSMRAISTERVLTEAEALNREDTIGRELD